MSNAYHFADRAGDQALALQRKAARATCASCVAWQKSGGRPKCMGEASPHYRQPRESSSPACANIDIGAEAPERVAQRQEWTSLRDHVRRAG